MLTKGSVNSTCLRLKLLTSLNLKCSQGTFFFWKWRYWLTSDLPSRKSGTEEATTDGHYKRVAGRNLCGHSAAGQEGSRVGCGGYRASFLGVTSDPCQRLLEDCACAPPLLQRIVVVGGAFWVSRREMRVLKWRARKRALAAGKRIAADKFAHPRISSGRGGGLGTLGNGSKRFRRSKPQGSALAKPTHSRVTSCTALQQLDGSCQIGHPDSAPAAVCP